MLNLITISLDSSPWIACIYVELMRLRIPWRWVVVEGASQPVSDTRWMKGVSPRLGRDGSHELLKDLSRHPWITHLHQPSWPGKTAQLNAGLAEFREEGVLLQVDSDELWTADQMEKIVKLFEDQSIGSAMFRCRYFVGPNKIAVGKGVYGDHAYEWLRAFRWKPGMAFSCHEPPKMATQGRMVSKDETEALGLVFDHHSYTTRKQCFEKSRLYTETYRDAVSGWEQLQGKEGKLKPFFPWVDDQVSFRSLNEDQEGMSK